ncbi:pantoate--beta-alanine ligase [Jiulongibacter sediminis]|uniref:Pantothenate synthetase n=1 Tax=Jiulongibacter sediminis TaxID=1605367 RepID=A0A0P7BAY8_9BACT|nr:pantoate--beta-alanine ligase [Jiulongibacter sediminis]KPM47607.1 pantoate--beta-alanine ligase [Jiulongibacter sediminis]TBX23398.1 pantoate--beta-alanine ligase [Jiulongibacter sediminis]
MKIINTIAGLKSALKAHRLKDQSLGFVPTMGALHPGHISLIDRARAENEVVVCSIFVNPTQFDNPDDLKKYPRTLEADCKLLEPVGCDFVFAPSAEEMYPTLPKLTFDFGNLEHVMEGKFRDGHFNGVGIVVSKLFHIVNPDRAYFGQKDLQQVAVLRRMVNDLSFDLELIPCPTLREKDGLAMSSRNTRLSAEARKIAPQLHAALQKAKDLLIQGKTAEETQKEIDLFFKNIPEFRLEYFEIADFDDLEPIEKMNTEGKTAICTAAYLDGVRLIDNIVF